MTERVKLEKRVAFIERLRKDKGFLLYFFTQFCKWSEDLIVWTRQWRSLTREKDKFRWQRRTTEDKASSSVLLFCLNEQDGLYYNVSLKQFECECEDVFPVEHADLCQEIMCVGFESFFIHHYCVPIHIPTLQSFIDITKEDYKASWIVDRSKQIIYFKFRMLCGEGAVKKTYLGWNVTKNIPIVVYQIQVSSNIMEQKRYVNEKRIAEVQRSPFLLSIQYHFSQREQQKIFMLADFMKYSIKTMMDINYPWSRLELQNFSLHILTALKVLHRLNIIHRDVKPSNILFDDEKNQYCLIDFGVATKFKLSSHRVETISTISEQLSLVGTVGYVSPEMYRSIYHLSHGCSVPYTFAVDVFSFGVTLLEMVTNQRAFHDDFSVLCESIPDNIVHHAQQFQTLLSEETNFLNTMDEQLRQSIGRYKSPKEDGRWKLKQILHAKRELVQQCLSCEAEERDSYLSELLENNQSITRYCRECKSDPDTVHIILQKTIEEHVFLSEMKGFEQFVSKLESYRKKSMEEMLDDVAVYPILFQSPFYEYPKTLSGVSDPVLLDFLRCCLHKDPNQRSTVDQLLQHSWIQSAQALSSSLSYPTDLPSSSN